MTCQWIKPFFIGFSCSCYHIWPQELLLVSTAECYLKLDISRLQDFRFYESSLNCLFFFFPELMIIKAKKAHIYNIQRQKPWKQHEFLCLSSVIFLAFCNFSYKMMEKIEDVITSNAILINWITFQVWGRSFRAMLKVPLSKHTNILGCTHSVKEIRKDFWWFSRS